MPKNWWFLLIKCQLRWENIRQSRETQINKFLITTWSINSWESVSLIANSNSRVHGTKGSPHFQHSIHYDEWSQFSKNTIWNRQKIIMSSRVIWTISIQRVKMNCKSVIVLLFIAFMISPWVVVFPRLAYHLIARGPRTNNHNLQISTLKQKSNQGSAMKKN